MYKILKKERLNSTVTRMVIEAPFGAKKAEPGQFIIPVSYTHLVETSNPFASR